MDILLLCYKQDGFGKGRSNTLIRQR